MRKIDNEKVIEGVVEYLDDNLAVIRSPWGFLQIEDYKSKYIIEHKEIDLKKGQIVEVYKIDGKEFLLDDLKLEHITREEVMKILLDCGVVLSEEDIKGPHK